MKEKGLFEVKMDHFGEEVCFRDFHQWQTGPALSIANIIIAHCSIHGDLQDQKN